MTNLNNGETDINSEDREDSEDEMAEKKKKTVTKRKRVTFWATKMVSKKVKVSFLAKPKKTRKKRK